MKKKINMIVKKDEANLRVDVFINKKENSISRTSVKNLILENKLKINNLIINSPSKKIYTDDVVELIIPEPKKTSLKPYEYKLNIVYEDKDLLTKIFLVSSKI